MFSWLEGLVSSIASSIGGVFEGIGDTIVNAIRQHVRILEKMEHGDLDGVRQEMNSHVKRINYEKADLISRYPDYFKTGDEPVGIQIGSL